MTAATDRPAAQPRIDPAGAAFALFLPLFGAALILATTALWADRLPDPLATHWSGSGGPNGYSGLWSDAWTLSAVLIVVGGGCAAPAASARGQLMLRRILLVTAAIVSGLITAVALAMRVTQLDLADPSQARLGWWPMGAGVAAGTAIGLLGAWLLRDRRVPVPAAAPPNPALPRRPDRTALTLTAGVPDRVLIVMLAVLAVLAVGTCLLAGSVWPLAIYAPILWLILVTARYRIVIGPEAITVVSAGLTMMTYWIDEVVGAQVTTVNPFVDFGGWGLRATGRGRYAVATASGPAVRIETACGDVLTVTTDRAEDAAGLINTLAADRFSGPATDTGGAAPA